MNKMTSTTFAESNKNKIIGRIGNTPLIELKSFSTKKIKDICKVRMVQSFWFC